MPWRRVGMTAIELQWGHGTKTVENVGERSCHPDEQHRFNGATALRPWRTGQSALHAIHGSERFNGATAQRPWRTLYISVHHVRRTTRFNGATAQRPWRTSATTVVSDCTSRCFNGATAQRPWRTPRCWSSSMPLASALQWGHGTKTVENCIQVVGLWSRLQGFNGATAQRPWRTEFVTTSIGKTIVTRFNGATAQRPWRTRRNSRRCCTAVQTASMGPRHKDRGERTSAWRWRHASGSCFNGATAQRPWRTTPDH